MSKILNDVIIYDNFEELDINIGIKERLTKMGMVVMTPVQKRCIPHLLEDKDLLGAAKTGSGKTLAFLVPMVEKIVRLSEEKYFEEIKLNVEKVEKKDFKEKKNDSIKNKSKKINEINHKLGTRGIILSPTRELSIQTFKILEMLVENSGLRAGLIIGGNNRDEEAKYLKQGIEIVVATPGRLLDHLNHTKDFKYDSLHTLVIDEADRLMNQGFLDDMKAIIRKLPKKRQTILFSATLNVNSAKLKNKMKKIKEIKEGQKLNSEEKVLTLACISLKESCVCVDISVEELTKGAINESTVSQLSQSYLICKEEDRFRMLCTLLQRNKKKKIMIFMSTCKEVNFYYTLLNIIKPMFIEGVTLMALQGKQKQSKRETCFETFRNIKCAVLLCTDVAARGLDIPLIDMVVQFDPPEDHKEYIHRVGRTARNGNAGQALIFLRNHEFDFISVLKKEKVPVQGVDIVEGALLPIQDAIDKVIENYPAVHVTAKEAFKTVVSAYVKNPNKHCFDINKLDLKALIRNFGLTSAPQVYIPTLVTKKVKKREAGMNSDDDNYYIPSKSSKYQ